MAAPTLADTARWSRFSATGQAWRSVAIGVLAWLLPLAAILAVAGRRWWQIGDPVSGLDAGEWLAYGRGALGGQGRSSGGAYPPFVPVMIRLGQLVLGPMEAARLVGAGSLAAVMGATYLAARTSVSFWFATMAAAIVGLASVVAEPVAYGGYPQNWALALIIAGATMLARYWEAGGRGRLLWAGVAFCVAALAHHMYFPFGLVVAIVVWLLWLTSRPATGVASRRTLAAIGIAAVASGCYLPSFLAFRRAGYDPPINATNQGMESAVRYAVREATDLWLTIILIGLIGLLVTFRHRSALWVTATALAIASAGLFLATREVRLLPPLVIGSALGLALLLQAIWSLARARQGAWGRLAWLAPLVALAAPLSLWPATDSQAEEFIAYYRVVDPEMVEMAAFVDDYPMSGMVAVRKGERDWPVGWWFEGLTDAKIAVGSDPRWLGFPRERDRAAMVGDLFSGRRTSDEIVAIAGQHDIDLLVFRKWEWIGWQRWQEEADPATEIIFDNEVWMAVDVRSEGERS